MNSMDRFLIAHTRSDPVSEKDTIQNREEEIQCRELCLTSREIIFDAIKLEIVHKSSDGHRNGALRVAISEEEAVFVGNSDGVRLIEGGSRRRREITETEEMGGVLRIKDAERRVLLDLKEDLKERFFREEEEA